MNLRNDIIRYTVDEFSKLPKFINQRIDDDGYDDFFCFALEGQEFPEETVEKYKSMMQCFRLGFAFYPYSEAMISVNRAFGKPNPLIEIKMINGIKINAVRQINYAVMFFDRTRLNGLKLREDMKYAFMEKFCDDMASMGSVPSNGMFIDIFESWKLFSKYRRRQIKFDSKYNEEFINAKIELDNDTSKLMKLIGNVQNSIG